MVKKNNIRKRNLQPNIFNVNFESGYITITKKNVIFVKKKIVKKK